MPRMNRMMRARALVLLEERQRKFCEINKLEWRGLFCEDMVRGGTWGETNWILNENGDGVKIGIRIIVDGEVAPGGLYGKIDHNGAECKGEWCVDHVDNDNDNNPEDGSNWALRCRGHNGRKNHRGLTRKESIHSLLKNNTLKESLKRMRERLGNYGKESAVNTEELVVRWAEFEKGKRCKKVVTEFVFEVLAGGAEMRFIDLCLACSAFTEKCFGPGEGVDQQTTERYVRVLCAPLVGDYEIFNKGRGDEKKDLWVRRRSDASPEPPQRGGEEPNEVK